MNPAAYRSHMSHLLALSQTALESVDADLLKYRALLDDAIVQQAKATNLLSDLEKLVYTGTRLRETLLKVMHEAHNELTKDRPVQ